MKKKQEMVITVLSALVFILALLVSARLWFRLDMTRGKIYTISALSRNLHKEIADTVTITYFVSSKLVSAHPFPNEAADLLREYAAYSGGKIRFLQKDPAQGGALGDPFRDPLRDRFRDGRGLVEDLGITPWQIEVAENNETTLATVYSGILIEYLEKEEVIPFVFSAETLEYDLSSRIISLVRNSARDIGVIVGDAYKDWHNDFALLDRELVLSGFHVRLINPGDEIPRGLPALFVLGGAEDLDVRSLFHIDNYILSGGNALFAADGVFVDIRGNLDARAMEDAGLFAMLANYGALIRPALVLDQTEISLTYQSESGVKSVAYPEWIGVRREMANPDHPLGARFAGLDLYWASPLELFPPPGVSAEILFSSTDEAWLQAEEFITSPDMAFQFENEKPLTLGRKILGAGLSGAFPGAFGGRHDADKPSRIIVIGDSDFAGSLMQASRTGTLNLEFLVRAADWLSGDDALFSIRNARSWQGPGRLDRIADRERKNAAMAFSGALNTVIIPLGIVAAGFIRCRKRGLPRLKKKGSPA